jgi:superfamily II DNA/RNA helicase
MEGLSPVLLANANKMGFKEFTLVQIESFAPIVAGSDVLARAPTGTGKTAAFMLPLLHRLVSGEKFRAIVLEPSRELVIQAANECRRLAAGTDIRVIAAYGGTDPRRQEDLIRAGSQVIVGTPSRVRELLQSRVLAASDVSVIVLDEADRLLYKQFAEDSSHIASQLPRTRQTLLFCVQMPADMMVLASKLLKPGFSTVRTGTVFGTTVSHFVAVGEAKPKLLAKLLRETPVKSVVFCSTVDSASDLAKALRYHGLSPVLLLHSELKPFQRHSVVKRFAAGGGVLVATDLVARGVHFADVKRVYSFDISQSFYLHRAGRTGRMRTTGECVSILTAEEVPHLRRVLSSFGITVAVLPSSGRRPARA